MDGRCFIHGMNPARLEGWAGCPFLLEERGKKLSDGVGLVEKRGMNENGEWRGGRKFDQQVGIKKSDQPLAR